jgi:hypothetical protein
MENGREIHRHDGRAAPPDLKDDAYRLKEVDAEKVISDDCDLVAHYESISIR